MPAPEVIIASAVGGGFGLLGIYIGARLSSNDAQDRDDRRERQREMDGRHVDVIRHLERLDVRAGELEQGVAALRAAVSFMAGKHLNPPD